MGAADPVARRPRPHGDAVAGPARGPDTRGEGEAEASRLLADAQKSDPNFFMFYRSLQSYRQALAESAPVLLLTPDAEFLKTLKSGPPEAHGRMDAK